MIDVCELIDDPDFCQDFTVIRSTGSWVNGDFVVTTPSTLTMTGVIEPMNTRDMQQLPEGDRITGALNVYTTEPLYTTRLNQSTGNSGGLSDEVVWGGENYKIIQVQNFSDYGYFKAAAVRKLGA